MFRWIPYAFIRIALYFVAGIVLAVFFPELIPEGTAIAILVMLVVLYIFCYFLFRFLRNSWFNLGIIGLPAIFIAGYVHLIGQTESRQPGHLSFLTQPVGYYKVVVNRYPEERARSWRAEGVVVAAFTKEWQPASGKIMLYFSKDSFEKPFRYGDVLVIRGAPQSVPAPANPGEFDYKKFLSYRNVGHQHFLKQGDVVLADNDPPSIAVAAAVRARAWADATLERYVTGTREQAIASALVLGVTDGLDNELLGAYAATGTMHVLAVSGLHISIIYMILVWAMKPLQRTASGKWILALTGLLVLWSYAFITGLSPSVLRAVTMFSFLALARPTGQSTNIYNTLAASAVCLLIVDPYMIMSVGFQLSYLAVLGIVYLEPRFYQLWEPGSWLLANVWKVTTVSVAAQLATFALGLFYFHQFPNYFLLSNLLVIPISFVVLIAGIAVLAVSFIPVMATGLGMLLTGSIWLLNEIVFVMESFPFSLIRGVEINAWQCWLLMAIIMALVLLTEQKKFRYLTVAVLSSFIFMVIEWSHMDSQVNIERITVYSVRGHSAIDLIDRGHAYFLADSILQADHQKIRYHIEPNRTIAGVEKVSIADPFIRTFGGGTLARWRGHTVLQVTGPEFDLPEAFSPDLIIISNNSISDYKDFTSRYRDTPIILDGTNSFGYSQQFLEVVRPFHTKVHAVLPDGAFDLVFTNNNV